MERSGYKKISAEDNQEQHVSIISLLLFQWMNEVVKTGSERALEKSDFLPLSKENSTCSVTEKLQTKWNEEKARSKRNNKRPKLWKSVLKMVSGKYALIIALMEFFDSVGRIIQPLFLGFLVSALISAEEPQKNVLLYCCAFAMAGTYFIRSIIVHQYQYRNSLLGIKLSSALKGLVYIKVTIIVTVIGASISTRKHKPALK